MKNMEITSKMMKNTSTIECTHGESHFETHAGDVVQSEGIVTNDIANNRLNPLKPLNLVKPLNGKNPLKPVHTKSNHIEHIAGNQSLGMLGDVHDRRHLNINNSANSPRAFVPPGEHQRLNEHLHGEDSHQGICDHEEFIEGNHEEFCNHD